MTNKMTVWYNAKISNPERPHRTYEAMVTDADGSIQWLGRTKDAVLYFPDLTDRHDLKGHRVLPGFIDSHLHLELIGKALMDLNVTGLSREATLEAIRKRAVELPPGSWIFGAQGWDNTNWTDPTLPTLAELDAVAPEHPVLLPRIDGHVSWFNTQAMERAGLSLKSPDPKSGTFSRNAAGQLTGLASERAAQLIRDAIPPREAAAFRDMILAAQDELLSYGITGVSDAYTTLPLIQALETLDAAGQLKLRTFGNLAVLEERGKDADAWAEILRRRKTGEFNGRLRLPGVKLFLDGSVGAHTAAFKEPYADRPDTRGALLYAPEELIEHFRWAKNEDLQVMIHAIGDRAAEVAVNAIADVLTEPEDTDRRWRIEHFQHADTATMDLAGYLGVIPSLQPLQEVNDRELLPQRLGRQRAHRAHRQRTFRYFVNHVVLNSDAPVDTPNPWPGIAAAVARQDGEALTLREALSAYSREPALVLGANRDLGTLDIGKQADFIVLDQDPFAAGTDLSGIKVLQTVIGGEIVYAA